MKLPTLSLHKYRWNGSLDLPAVSRALSKTLSEPPYACQVAGFTVPVDDAEFLSIVDWMGQRSAELAGRQLKRASFTKVRINPREADKQRPVTAYSRTNLPLPPHTDSSYLPMPHELVGFQCITPAEQGGINSIVCIDQILEKLDPHTVGLLQQSVFPFGRGEHAILSKDRRPTIRYYKGQLEHALALGATLAEEFRAAVKTLDATIAELETLSTVRLMPGDALILNNVKALHGRTGFETNSARALIRLRQHVDLLKLGKEKLGWRNTIKYLFGKPDLPLASANAASKPTNRTEVQTVDLKDVGPEHRSEPLESYHHLLCGDQDLNQILEAAQLTLRIGRHAEAKALYERALEITPENRQLLFPLSALNYYKGQQQEAEEYLKKAAQVSAFSGVYSENGAPRVLRVRGLKGIKHTLMKGRNGYHESFQRGHFSLKDLCNLRQFDTVSFAIYDGITKAELPEDLVPELFLNTVACGDRMPGTLEILSEILKANPDVPVINHPNNILKSSRENNARRFAEIPGVIFPKTKGYAWTGDNPEGLVSRLEEDGFQYPVILRPQGTHTGSGMAKANNRSEALRYFAKAEQGEDYYVIQYHELADDRGLYNKTRVFFIDGTLYPVAHLTHNDWNVHSGDRYTVMDKNPFMQEREKLYHADIEAFFGKSILEKLSQINELMGLDFFGIDFTVTKTGELFIFEANAAMRHNFDHATAFPYTRAPLRAVSHAFNTMVLNRLGLLDH